MQISGSDATKTQIQPSKQKREITNISQIVKMQREHMVNRETTKIKWRRRFFKALNGSSLCSKWCEMAKIRIHLKLFKGPHYLQV